MKYLNPIIKGFNPDPSICRVLDDYYIVTSSFEYFPGIPIYHSRDLVNWKQIGNCITRIEQLPLENAGNSKGIWAPAIRYNNGIFYVTATLAGKGNFIVSANDILGEWSDPVWVKMGGIDPSLYFENEKAYYCTNAREHSEIEEISLAEIDIYTGDLIGDYKAIWTGTGGGWLEAPHIYHIGEWYYLLAAEGGTSLNHMVTVARSKDIWGPYEGCPENPILTNRNDTSKQIQCSGHGDLVDDKNGNWWLVHLGTRPNKCNKTNLGRETFLTPIKWKNDWPCVQDKKAKIENEADLWNIQKNHNSFYCNFENPNWEPQWLFLRSPNENLYKRQDGKLWLYPSCHTFENQVSSPAFVAVRPTDFECETETVFNFMPDKIGDEAGLIIYLQSDFHYRICKRKTETGNYVVVEKTADDFKQIVFMEEIPQGEICFKIRSDKQFYHFYYSIGSQPMKYICNASVRFLSSEIADRSFTGTVMGIYSLSNEVSSTVAVFNEFSISSL